MREILKVEVVTFNENLEKWLATYEGKFALVVGDRLIGTFDTAEAAFEAGVAHFGGRAMLIRRIERQQAVDRNPALLCGWCARRLAGA